MVSNSIDFNKKLRAAVKAKLEEFGLDVDDELPDYIMIMVGNKKEKARMKTDLQLFLCENTSVFVEWLFGFFQKLKTVTNGEPSTSINNDSTTVNLENTKKKDETSAKIKSSKHSDETKIHSSKLSKSTNKTDKKQEKIKPEKSQIIKKKDSTIESSLKKKKLSNDQLKKSYKDESKHSKSHSEKSIVSIEHKHHSEHHKNKPSETIISNKKSESNSLTISNCQSNENKEVVDIESETVNKHKEHLTNLNIETSNEDKLNSNSDSTLQQRRPIVFDNEQQTNENNLIQKNIEPLPQKISSKVVIKKSLEPTSPKVSSKVVVLRKINENNQQQAGSSAIFKKAISEAASISAGYGTVALRNNRKNILTEKERDNNNCQITANNKKTDFLNANKKGMERIIVTVSNPVENNNDSNKRLKIQFVNNDNSSDNLNIEENKNRKMPLKSSFIDLSNINSNNIKKVTTENESSIDMKDLSHKLNHQKRKRIVYDNSKINQDENSLIDNKKFKGLNNNNNLNENESKHLISQKNKKHSDSSKVFHRLSGINPKMMRLVKSAIEKAKITDEYDPLDVSDSVFDTETNELVDDKKKTNLFLDEETTKDNNTSSSDDEAEIDAVLATAQAAREETLKINSNEIPTSTTISTAGSNTTMINDSVNKTIVSTMNSTLNRNEEFTNKLERCRFWPDCRNEDVCPFYHPSKPCTAFPNCWYRDKCLFIHPSCKFGMKCSKINCIYAHYKTSPNIGNIQTTCATTTLAPNSNTISSLTNIIAPTIPISTTTINNVTSTTTTTTTTTITSISNVAPVIQISNTPTTTTSPSTLSNIACHYNGRCQNLKCPYKHPPICRFGLNCLNKSCYFLHRKVGANFSLSKVYNVPLQSTTSSTQSTTIS